MQAIQPLTTQLYSMDTVNDRVRRKLLILLLPTLLIICFHFTYVLTLNFMKILKCQGKCKRKPPYCTFKTSVCVFLSNCVWGTLYDRSCIYFSKQMMGKLTGRFSTLSLECMHLTECNLGHSSLLSISKGAGNPTVWQRVCSFKNSF